MPPQKRLRAFAAAFCGIDFLISFPWRHYIDESSNQEVFGVAPTAGINEMQGKPRKTNENRYPDQRHAEP